jgi:tRNA(Ile2) C34 agmatinyltransferase TiaS
MVAAYVEREPLITVTQEPRREACPRCKGRMLADGDQGDRACFNCGYMIYKEVPLPPIEGGERRPSHGGKSLW